MAKKQMRMDDEEDYEVRRVKKQHPSKKKKKKKKKHIFLRIVLVLLIIIAILFGMFVGFIYSKLDKMEYNDIDETQIEVNEGVETTGYRNILLLGVDSRDNDYKNTLSDSIMIVSINQDNKKVRIASVYRDSYLKIKKSYDKVTHAFMKGGPALSLSTINTNLDLDLKEYVAINFNVVVDIIDEIGGIDMEITSAEVKWINGYINEVNEVTNHHSEHITEPGMYHLDGVQAVSYSRIRHTAGGDFKRTERQRNVLNLAFEKVKKMNLVQLNNLADKVLGQISTNIPKGQLVTLLAQASSYNIDETTGWPYEVMDYKPAKVSYVAPIDLSSQVKKLHHFLFEKEEYEVSKTVQNISDELARMTGTKSTKNTINTNKNVNKNTNNLNTNTNTNTNTNKSTKSSKNTNSNKDDL